MKKFLVVAATIASFAAGESFAQSKTATVSLTVNSSITFTKVRDLNLGTVVVGVTSDSVDAVTGGANAAYFTLLGSASTPVEIQWASLGALSDGNGHTINWTPYVAGNNSGTQASATYLTSGNFYSTNASGNYYYWVGASASLSPTQSAGSYSGSVQLTVNY